MITSRTAKTVLKALRGRKGLGTTKNSSKPRTRRTGQPSALEAAFAAQVRTGRLPEPVTEHRFDVGGRKWRFDFCWPAQRVAVEVEGGHWAGGRHTRGKGFEADAEKYNQAALQGWRVLRVTRTHLDSGQALAWVREALGA